MGVAIATFTQPIHGTSVRDNLPRIVVAISIDEQGGYLLHAIDSDGVFHTMLQPEFNVGLRYDMRSETWIDVSSGSTDDEEDE